MKDDISHILDSWKFNSNDLNVRLITGQDGAPKIQIRLDLGILQMELDGRPDSRRPHNFETYFDYFKYRAQKSEQKVTSKGFQLSTYDCFLLQQEAIQFYQRYTALMKLKDYDRVVRDSQHNLLVTKFVKQYCDNEDIVWQFDQYTPYIIMMHTRAKVCICLENKDYEKALKLINIAIRSIESYNSQNKELIADEQPELEFLTSWADEIRELKPISRIEQLEKELNRAVKQEKYERAAQLRDEIAALRK